jgi:hypothetical protein
VKISNQDNNLLAVIIFMALAIVSRFLGPWVFGNVWNFAPLNAIALFSGAYIIRKPIAFLVPLLFVWIGDMMVSYFHYGRLVVFYDGFYWQYLTYILIVLLGSSILLNRIKPLRVLSGGLLASVLFFLLTNFGSWLTFNMYPMTWQGLMACYVAGIPFFKQTLLSDLVYIVFLFGSFEWLRRSRPALMGAQA